MNSAAKKFIESPGKVSSNSGLPPARSSVHFFVAKADHAERARFYLRNSEIFDHGWR